MVISEPRDPTVVINKGETLVELLGQRREDVKYLCVYADNKNADLGILKDYPNVETLFVNGNFADVGGISELRSLNRLIIRLTSEAALTDVRVPRLKSLSVYDRLNEGFEGLIGKSLEYLELMEMRKVNDLSFVEKAAGLKKLYLMSLPAVEKLPDLGKMPNLYGLKVYELHKLNDIESLTRSAIRYLDLTLAADKLSGTKIADVLLRMEHLERFSGILDRSDKRDGVLYNRLEKSGKSDICNSFDMNEWREL